MNKQKVWQHLVPGDSVEIIAPASHSPSHKLEDGIDWIKSIGLIPKVPIDIIKTDLFFAAPLEIQLTHLKDALYSDSKAIWCLRGGYGSMRLIPHLLKLSPPKKPKLFIGFSDITSLHLFFTQHWKWPTIHGRTISQMHPDFSHTPDRKFLKDIIFGKKDHKVFKGLKPLNEPARLEQGISGKITGGNLRILQSSLGTAWELKARGKILFIEDVAERGYSIDRMLEQMLQAKIIHKGLKAVVFGDFTQGFEKDGKDLSLEAIKRFAQRVSYPVLRGLPAGHGDEVNFPIPFNTTCHLQTGKNASLKCSYGISGVL
jgi:muramoyltetrapeptide carboxypeptidase